MTHPQRDLNEAKTRRRLINKALEAAQWETTPHSHIDDEHPIDLGRLIGNGKRAQARYADYVLTYHGKKLAVIEAKRTSRSEAEGVQQAKDYAAALNIRYAYATNGYNIYRIDMHTGQEQYVAAYPSPDQLWQATYHQPNHWRQRFAAIDFETKSGTWQPRYYQYNAIEATLEAIINGQDRILLTLATGTGKTAISFQIAWKLFKSRWNVKAWRGDKHIDRQPRILFLADRNILADQAFSAFSAFEDDAMVRIDPDAIRKKHRVPKNGNLFFTIFQTFMSGKTDANGQEKLHYGDYPPDFFDLIIIDECHRGGANDEGNWRKILEYFKPAVQLGLTATPKRQGNVDTYRYFGEPVYSYSLKAGINDGFLTPFRIKRIASNIDNYTYEPDDDVEGEIDPHKTYTESDFNVSIEIKDRERHRVKTLLELIDPREKTLVFCATQAHAAFIRDTINQLKTIPEPNYCVRVVADDGARGETLLKQFQNNENTIPTVLTTSRKLSTGVDARNVRHIALLRPVKSMIEFKQIIGRGTRLYDHKDHFTLYDFVKAYAHFEDKEWDGDPDPCAVCGELACLCAASPCSHCNQQPCVCPPPVCKQCATHPCICEPDRDADHNPAHCEVCDAAPCQCLKQQTIQVSLSANRKLQLTNMIVTEFIGVDSKPMTAEQYLQQFYQDLPHFFQDEDELRRLWRQPDTRQNLLEGLQAKGYSDSALQQVAQLLNAEHSDLFDVLVHLAYELPLKTRTQRVAEHKARIQQGYNYHQRSFIDFILSHYIDHGVSELAPDKLKRFINLKYQGVRDMPAELGNAAGVRQLFNQVQERLYERL